MHNPQYGKKLKSKTYGHVVGYKCMDLNLSLDLMLLLDDLVNGFCRHILVNM
jgi:hypothetical protein